jgi:hypothetical protein
MTPDDLSLTQSPEACLSWKIGPDGPVGPNGYRLPSNVWGGVALFADRSGAEAAFAASERFLPLLADTVESWHALLLPIAHRGECNHLERSRPRLMFEPSAEDPGGPLFVMTTAGYVMGPDLDLARVIDFRVHVDKVHGWLQSAEGRVASQVFTPHTVGDDGVTMSLWRSDSAMIDTMYRPGFHRIQIERQRRDNLADRTSFTRFRVLKTRGRWNGSDPFELAGGRVGSPTHLPGRNGPKPRDEKIDQRTDA